jgi:D-arginine dehydrogenase
VDYPPGPPQKEAMETRFIVIGAGMAGASAAAFLADHGPTLVLEAEAHAGHHATGRSAASYIDTYGHPTVCAVTRAARDFFWTPPEGFAEHPLVRPRADLQIAGPEGGAILDGLIAEHGAALRPVDAAEVRRLCPILRPEIDWRGAVNDGSADIDVDGLLQGFLRLARAKGAQVMSEARVTGLDRTVQGWRVTTSAGVFEAPFVINAAGAWAGEIGRLAGLGDLGLAPFRRTAVRLTPSQPEGLADWPFVIDVEDRFYFKPDAGGLMLSPVDETPSDPCDAWAEDLDVAYAVQAFEDATTEQVRRVTHTWAGLRTFAPDRVPVMGADPREPAFFWLAGQGGYGIQTAPAMGQAVAALLTTGKLPQALQDQGVTAADLAPNRLV